MIVADCYHVVNVVVVVVAAAAVRGDAEVTVVRVTVERDLYDMVILVYLALLDRQQCWVVVR